MKRVAGASAKTGPGCVTSIRHGVAKVCHISTGAEFGDCKAEWDKLKANDTNVFEFRPSEFIGDTACTKCDGLITLDLQTFAVLLDTKRVARPQGGFSDSDLRFVKIEKARLLR